MTGSIHAASTPILFLGPVRAGKSALAGLVAARLRLPHISLDDLRWEYYREGGYEDELAHFLRHPGYRLLAKHVIYTRK